MPLRCPLCLARITITDLLYFCMMHEFDPMDHDALCACRESPQLEAGIFVSHNGCKSQNPLFGRPINSDREVLDLGDTTVHVSHWELAMLARAAELHPNRSEMWFPYSLLQAIREPRALSELGSRRIKLVGAREVGKTTLASLALRPESYREDDVPHYSVHSFVYVTPSAGGASPERPFLEALRLTNVFADAAATTQQLLTPTLIRTTSVRATFLLRQVPDARTRGARDTFTVPNFLMDIAQPRRKPYTAAAVFYDFAGEEAETTINYLTHAQHNQFADVIAVAIDATDIDCFGIPRPRNKPNSLKAALRQLQSIHPGPTTRLCLIVTHLDSIRDRATRTGPTVPTRLPTDPAEARRLIYEWLNASESTSTPDRAVASELAARQVATFLLWVENLSAPENIARARGLVNWLDWCFNNRLLMER